ncbi:MAG: TonB-dependent receptor [Pseudomonadota bacterium]
MICNQKAVVLYLLILGGMMLSLSPYVSASETLPVEDTLLIFVGENVEMLTLASRREESAWQAPAVADVVSFKEIRQSGAQTLAQVLETVPGFCIAQKEYGYKPYLRGVQDSVLFLYDTVPLGLESDKSFNPLGYNLSLSGIKRIEIIRGPGSVLWGPDAFTGIVNVVPMTGKDLDGVETGLVAGGQDLPYGAFINAGNRFGDLSTFFSCDVRQGSEDERLCNISRFWGNGDSPVSPELRYAETCPDDSRYLDMSFRVDHSDLFSVVARLSDASHSYSVTGADGQYTYRELEHNPMVMIRAEGGKDIGNGFRLRFSGYAVKTDVGHDIIDIPLDYSEDTYFLEALLDSSCFNCAGLFTIGASFRKKEISGVPVWQSYLPDFIGPGNTTLLPIIDNQDISESLSSLFSQYRHSFGRLDLSAGIRFDAYDLYRDAVSFNAGIVWSPSSDWVFKCLLGTAYRTPFVAQLEEGKSLEPEQVTSLNLQGIYKFNEKSRVSLGLFGNRIEHHVLEDIYAGAGVSTPNDQDITGAELSLDVSPLKSLDLSASITLLRNTGPDETYRKEFYRYLDGDGNLVILYEDLNYGYDPGSKGLFSLSGTWTPVEDCSFSTVLRYFSSRDLYYLDKQEQVSTPGAWILDASLVFSNVSSLKLDFGIYVKNLLDEHYSVPGTYTTIDGQPLSVYCVLRKRW